MKTQFSSLHITVAPPKPHNGSPVTSLGQVRLPEISIAAHLKYNRNPDDFGKVYLNRHLIATSDTVKEASQKLGNANLKQLHSNHFTQTLTSKISMNDWVPSVASLSDERPTMTFLSYFNTPLSGQQLYSLVKDRLQTFFGEHTNRITLNVNPNGALTTETKLVPIAPPNVLGKIK